MIRRILLGSGLPRNPTSSIPSRRSALVNHTWPDGWLGPTGTATVIGNSMEWRGPWHALTYPERVDRLVLIDTCRTMRNDS